MQFICLRPDLSWQRDAFEEQVEENSDGGYGTANEYAPPDEQMGFMTSHHTSHPGYSYHGAEQEESEDDDGMYM